MCAKRPSPRRELPIGPEDCTLLTDAMMLLFEDMTFDFAAHGVDYDHANAAYDRLFSGQTAHNASHCQHGSKDFIEFKIFFRLKIFIQ